MLSTPSKTRYWREHIERWSSSGLSQRAYCEQHDLKPHNLSYWKNKLDTRQTSAAEDGFVPVVLESIPAPLASGLSVLHPNGVRVEGFSSVQDIATVIKAL